LHLVILPDCMEPLKDLSRIGLGSLDPAPADFFWTASSAYTPD
jgi:hypothetical protein